MVILLQSHYKSPPPPPPTSHFLYLIFLFLLLLLLVIFHRYNGRVLFGARVTTTFLTSVQMKKLKMGGFDNYKESRSDRHLQTASASHVQESTDNLKDVEGDRRQRVKGKKESKTVEGKGADDSGWQVLSSVGADGKESRRRTRGMDTQQQRHPDTNQQKYSSSSYTSSGSRHKDSRSSQVNIFKRLGSFKGAQLEGERDSKFYEGEAIVVEGRRWQDRPRKRMSSYEKPDIQSREKKKRRSSPHRRRGKSVSSPAAQEWSTGASKVFSENTCLPDAARCGSPLVILDELSSEKSPSPLSLISPLTATSHVKHASFSPSLSPPPSSPSQVGKNNCSSPIPSVPPSLLDIPLPSSPSESEMPISISSESEMPISTAMQSSSSPRPPLSSPITPCSPQSFSAIHTQQAVYPTPPPPPPPPPPPAPSSHVSTYPISHSLYSHSTSSLPTSPVLVPLSFPYDISQGGYQYQLYPQYAGYYPAQVYSSWPYTSPILTTNVASESSRSTRSRSGTPVMDEPPDVPSNVQVKGEQVDALQETETKETDCQIQETRIQVQVQVQTQESDAQTQETHVQTQEPDAQTQETHVQTQVADVLTQETHAQTKETTNAQTQKIHSPTQKTQDTTDTCFQPPGSCILTQTPSLTETIHSISQTKEPISQTQILSQTDEIHSQPQNLETDLQIQEAHVECQTPDTASQTPTQLQETLLPHTETEVATNTVGAIFHSVAVQTQEQDIQTAVGSKTYCHPILEGIQELPFQTTTDDGAHAAHTGVEESTRMQGGFVSGELDGSGGAGGAGAGGDMCDSGGGSGGHGEGIRGDGSGSGSGVVCDTSNSVLVATGGGSDEDCSGEQCSSIQENVVEYSPLQQEAMDVDETEAVAAKEEEELSTAELSPLSFKVLIDNLYYNFVYLLILCCLCLFCCAENSCRD